MSVKELETKIVRKDLEGIIQETTRLLMGHCGFSRFPADDKELKQTIKELQDCLKEKDAIIKEAEIKIASHAELSEGLVKTIQKLESELKEKPKIDIKANMQPLEDKIKEQAEIIKGKDTAINDLAKIHSNDTKAFEDKVKSLEEQLSKFEELKKLIKG